MTFKNSDIVEKHITKAEHRRLTKLSREDLIAAAMSHFKASRQAMETAERARQERVSVSRSHEMVISTIRERNRLLAQKESELDHVRAAFGTERQVYRAMIEVALGHISRGIPPLARATTTLMGTDDSAVQSGELWGESAKP